MVNQESLATRVSLENQEILVILADQENLGLQEDLVKVVLMETNTVALSVLKYMHQMEILVMLENREDVENKDPEDPLESPVMMLSAILENTVKMVNLENLEDLEKMVHLENLAMMVTLEITVI